MDALWPQFDIERLCEREHKRLSGGIASVEAFWHQSDDGRDVYDRSRAFGGECICGGDGEGMQDIDVEMHHSAESVLTGVQDIAARPDAGAVDAKFDILVFSDALEKDAEVAVLAQIERQWRDGDCVTLSQVVGGVAQPFKISCDHDEVITSGGEPVGVN
ncbi:hypothetical protein PPNSA23_28700 [Phyllobacterium phragmitis]|uniref:Uncharacterized protein n=1 Tax=Phyllobacterium phragmitis TaxID=2670329 RepID=A0ABQ0H1X7_9HYPH